MRSRKHPTPSLDGCQIPNYDQLIVTERFGHLETPPPLSTLTERFGTTKPSRHMDRYRTETSSQKNLEPEETSPWSPKPTSLRSPQLLPHLQPRALRQLQKSSSPSPPGTLAIHLRWRGAPHRAEEEAKAIRGEGWGIILDLWTNVRREKSPWVRALWRGSELGGERIAAIS